MPQVHRLRCRGARLRLASVVACSCCREPVPELREPDARPAPREVIDANLAKMRAIVKRIPGMPERLERPKVELLRDVGHGSECTCEMCWNARMAKRAP